MRHVGPLGPLGVRLLLDDESDEPDDDGGVPRWPPGLMLAPGSVIGGMFTPDVPAFCAGAV